MDRKTLERANNLARVIDNNNERLEELRDLSAGVADGGTLELKVALGRLTLLPEEARAVIELIETRLMKQIREDENLLSNL